MKFIISGASGFVGSTLVNHLSKLGIGGWAVSRSGELEAPKHWLSVQRDLLLGDHALKLLGDELCCLVNLEVKHHITNPTLEDCKTFRQVNVEGLRQWLRWCQDHGVDHVISFSSIKAVKSADTVLDETAAGPGDSPYGASKWEAEQLLSEWVSKDKNRSGLVVRPAVIYGPGNLANIYSFVSAIHRGRFFLIGDSGNVKSLVSIQNVVSAVNHLAMKMEPGFRIYNLVDSNSYSVAELASMIGHAFGKEGQFRSIPWWFARFCGLVGDFMERGFGRAPLTTQRLKALTETSSFLCEKLIQEGFKHPQTTEEGIAELVDWYLKEGKNQNAVHH
jgi:nucleoside-diphosphate-sugar epimerase